MPEGGTTVERRVGVSESAARRIAFLKTQEDAAGAFLRVAVSGGGCSGFQYGFSFDDTRQDGDVVFEPDGGQVIVDDTSLDLLNGATIHFVEHMIRPPFQLNHPNP